MISAMHHGPDSACAAHKKKMPPSPAAPSWEGYVDNCCKYNKNSKKSKEIVSFFSVFFGNSRFGAYRIICVSIGR